MAEEKKEEHAQKPEEGKASEAKEDKKVQAEATDQKQAEDTKEIPAVPQEPEKAEEKAEEAPAAPIKKKVNRMTLAEVNAKLKEVAEHQGGHESKYASTLLKRKSYLESKK
jgi:hypothetical protein